jgi:hypothetical protein
MTLVPTEPDALYIGTTSVDKVYQGNEQIWPEPIFGWWSGLIGPPTPYTPIEANLPHGHFTARTGDPDGHKYWSWWDGDDVYRIAEMKSVITAGQLFTMQVSTGESLVFASGALNMNYNGGALLSGWGDYTIPVEQFFIDHEGKTVNVWIGDIVP